MEQTVAPSKAKPSPSQTSYTSEARTPVELDFSALGSLAQVAVGEGWEERVGGGVQVSMAESWGKNR